MPIYGTKCMDRSLASGVGSPRPARALPVKAPRLLGSTTTVLQTMEVGLFASSSGSPSRLTAQRQRDASEVEFLKQEVRDLERVIKSLHSSRLSDRAAREEAAGRTTAALEEAERQHAADTRHIETTSNALMTLRADHAGAIAVAAAREAEGRVLTVELRLLALELIDAEAEREAAREAEASALSIARSYRRFAAQGAGRLDDMRLAIEAVQGNLLQRITHLHADSLQTLRLRGLRAVCGWQVGRDVGAAFGLWRTLVWSAEHREAVMNRLEVAYRQRDIDTAAARVRAAGERRQARESDTVSRGAYDPELREATLERERALAASAAEAERRSRSEARVSTLEAQLERARREAHEVKRAAATELAACREELLTARREAGAARDAQRHAEAASESAAADVAAAQADLDGARAEAAAQSAMRQEEERTRRFLERVIRDERMHAAARATEVSIHTREHSHPLARCGESACGHCARARTVLACAHPSLRKRAWPMHGGCLAAGAVCPYLKILAGAPPSHRLSRGRRLSCSPPCTSTTRPLPTISTISRTSSASPSYNSAKLSYSSPRTCRSCARANHSAACRTQRERSGNIYAMRLRLQIQPGFSSDCLSSTRRLLAAERETYSNKPP